MPLLVPIARSSSWPRRRDSGATGELLEAVRDVISNYDNDYKAATCNSSSCAACRKQARRAPTNHCFPSTRESTDHSFPATADAHALSLALSPRGRSDSRISHPRPPLVPSCCMARLWAAPGSAAAGSGWIGCTSTVRAPLGMQGMPAPPDRMLPLSGQ